MAKIRKKADASERGRKFNVQRSYYYDTHDEKGAIRDTISEADWKEKIIKEWSSLLTQPEDFLIMIFHDRDYEKDGSFTALHAHAVFSFKSARTVSAMVNSTGVSSSANIGITKDMTQSVSYLLHITDKALQEMKTVYGFDKLIFAGGIDEMGVRGILAKRKSSGGKSKLGEDDIVTDYIVGLHEAVFKGRYQAFAVQEMLTEKFGAVEGNKLWLKERRAFERDEEEFQKRAVYEAKKQNFRPLSTVYIYGEGGAGKSTLADAMAKLKDNGRGTHSAPTPSKGVTFDFVSSYEFENVTIFNELTPNAFGMREFCSIFEDSTFNLVASRNRHRAWLARYSYITNTIPVEQFIDEMLYHSDSKYHSDAYKPFDYIHKELNDKPETINAALQIRRRIPHVVNVEKIGVGDACTGRITLSRINETLDGYDEIAVFDYDWHAFVDKGDEGFSDKALEIAELINAHIAEYDDAKFGNRRMLKMDENLIIDGADLESEDDRDTRASDDENDGSNAIELGAENALENDDIGASVVMS